jgi:hypothetical protein
VKGSELIQNEFNTNILQYKHQEPLSHCNMLYNISSVELYFNNSTHEKSE